MATRDIATVDERSGKTLLLPCEAQAQGLGRRPPAGRGAPQAALESGNGSGRGGNPAERLKGSAAAGGSPDRRAWPGWGGYWGG